MERRIIEAAAVFIREETEIKIMEISTNSYPKMTIEQIINILQGLVFNSFNRTTKKEREALDEAIKILRKEVN